MLRSSLLGNKKVRETPASSSNSIEAMMKCVRTRPKDLQQHQRILMRRRQELKEMAYSLSQSCKPVGFSFFIRKKKDIFAEYTHIYSSNKYIKKAHLFITL